MKGRRIIDAMVGKGPSNPGKVPKRFWWTKRIFLAWLLLVAALLISRFVWGWEADRRVDAELGAITVRGEEIDWAKLAPPNLAPEDNAATYYERAAKAIDLGSEGAMELPDCLKVASLRGQYEAKVDSLLAANQRVFDDCRAARGKAVNWGTSHATPYSPTFLDYGSQRGLAKLLCLKAGRQAQLGDSQGVVETLLDAEALVRAANQDTLLIGYLVSVAMAEIVDETAIWAAPSLTIEGQATTAASRPAAAQSVRQLIRVLLDRHALTGCKQSLVAERAATYSQVSGMSTTGLIEAFSPITGTLRLSDIPRPPDLCNWPLAPMYRAGIAHMLHRYGQEIDAAGQATMPLAATRLPPELPRNPGVFKSLALLVPSVDNVGGKVDTIAFGSEAYSRLTATALALRLYELEKGHPAKSLAELVPEYLPAVPADPFEPASGPIRALLSDAKPRVYSLGENMKDNGGSRESVSLPGFTVPRPADIVVYLRLADMPEPDVSRYAAPTSQPAPESDRAEETTEPTSQPAAD